jgi:hypothetical protein
MSTTCPACGADSTGRFCSDCGAALDASCRGCGGTLVPGGRFCNACGAAVGATPSPARSPALAIPALPLAIGVVAVALVIGVWVLPRITGDDAATPAAVLPAPSDPRAVDLASMSPREAADRLFNRVMEGLSGGDTTRLAFFSQMALDAYAAVPERDADLHYHVAELHLVRREPEAALAHSDSILASDPGHLFGLFTAAGARRMLGDDQGATAAFRAFVDGYAAQVARDLPEYRDHAAGLPAMRGEAESALGMR